VTVFDTSTLAALANVQRILVTPAEFDGEREWRQTLASSLRALFGVDHALVMRPGVRDPYIGDGLDRTTLEAMARFHDATGPDATASDAPPRVRYADPTLETLQARRLAVPDPVFTRRGNEVAMGEPMEATAMFEETCRPIGIHDFAGIFARTPLGDLMLFLAHGRRRMVDTRVGNDAVPLLRVLAPVVPVALTLDAQRTGGVSLALPSVTTLRAQFAFTRREAEVALLLARGHTLRAVADSLGVSPSTARFHTEAVFRKLGVHHRAAVALALMDAPR
jgi:DNA-binding CsgD family transcriptional regulator